MASIRQRIETIFAAMAFAQANSGDQARELLEELREKQPQTARAVRPDNRPRMRA